MEFTPYYHVLLCLRGVVIFLRLLRVVLGHLALALAFSLLFGGAFSLIRVRRSKVSLLLFKLLLNLENVLVYHAKRGDVHELHFILDVLL